MESKAMAMAMAMAMESFDMESTSPSARSALLPALATLQRHPFPTSAPLLPVFASCYRCGTVGGRSFASSTQPPEMKGVKDYKLPKGVKDYKLPPVNPPDKENPDAATLRAQWDNAVRLYGRMYSHAWGTAILAGVALFGIGWWVKGENPLKALSPTGEIKKEETAE